MYAGSSEMEQVVCVDTMVEGVHFRKDTLSSFQIGKKALAINISDIAAMGAIPTYYLVSVAVPPTWTEEELSEIYEGMNELAKRYEIDLIGGDTVSSNDALVITVTAIGKVEQGKAIFRSDARADDIVFLTGYVGGSAAGLDVLFEKGFNGLFSDKEKQLVKAHQEPTPHVEAGRILAKSNARISLNDVSDGVASEANELAEASQARLIIEQERIPLHPAMSEYSVERQLKFAMFGGEDFVLIGTVPKEKKEEISTQFRKSGLPFHEIGFMEAGEPSVFIKEGNERKKIQKHGYNHFQKRG
ncbi:thiamine-monophosphate kinase [Halalkalibacter wakoensis JCM 9140]|uniref:Thiamine-monophosphate kinase n=1 Tax=Halalkalibacter wakoensis JCM 9140 TaxID=1236970 RepID=W4Q5A6_9BACI|nr:thiamine-monophosphate kinase [Halalkalibacter wakoensis JCM 9140]